METMLFLIGGIIAAVFGGIEIGEELNQDNDSSAFDPVEEEENFREIWLPDEEY